MVFSAIRDRRDTARQGCLNPEKPGRSYRDFWKSQKDNRHRPGESIVFQEIVDIRPLANSVQPLFNERRRRAGRGKEDWDTLDRTEKEQVVAELRERLGRATAAILADYRGMTVAEMTELRDALAAEQVECRVVKNTLMRLASQDSNYAALQQQLKGTCAVVIGYSDPSIPAKVLKKFKKTNEKLQVKGGVLGNRLLNPDQVAALADLPPREELLAKLLGTLNAVPTGLVSVLSGVPRAFVGVLAAIQRQRESA